MEKKVQEGVDIFHFSLKTKFCLEKALSQINHYVISRFIRVLFLHTFIRSLNHLKTYYPMKKLVVALVLAIPFFIHAQQLSKDITVTKSTPFPVVDARLKEYVSLENGTIVSAKTTGERVTIQTFDYTGMKEIGRSVTEDFPPYLKPIGLQRTNAGVFYIFNSYNKKTKQFTVYSREIDVASAKFKESKKLFTTSGPVVANNILLATSGVNMFGIGAYVQKFSVKNSFDNSKILVQYRTKPLIKDDSKNYDKLGFYVFDDKLSKLWGKEVKMPHTEKEMNNLAYTVSNQGKAYMLARINSNKSFEVITISDAGLTNKKVPVKEGLYFQQFSLTEKSDGTITAAGYYANGVDFKMSWNGNMSTSLNVNGIYAFDLKDDGSLSNVIDYEFPLELIKKNLSERQKKKAAAREKDGKAGIPDLTMREVVANDDGSILFVGETYYTRKEMWMTSTENVTHFGHSVITKFDASGNVVWSEKLPKDQAALATDLNAINSLGSAYAKGPDGHYLIFVDNRKNAAMPADGDPVPHKGGFGGYLTAFRVDDATGKVEKHLIADLTDIQGTRAYQFRVDRIFQAAEKSFLLEIYIKKKNDMMIKIDLNK